MSFEEPSSSSIKLKNTRRRSRILSSFSDDSFVFPFYNEKFYCALYEYCQGSNPQAYWESGPPLLMNNDAFKQSVLSIPAFGNSESVYPEPIVVVSSYEKIYYIAVYAQILDAEARGFTRSFVLVISNRSNDIIKNIHFLKLNQILSLVKMIQKQPKKVFMKEIIEYGLNLKATIDSAADESTKMILQSKIHELHPILTFFNLSLPSEESKCEVKNDVQNESDVKKEKDGKFKDFDYFIKINNNLREFTSMSDWHEIEKNLMSFTEEINQLTYGANLAAYGSYREDGPCFDFSHSRNQFSVFISGVFFSTNSVDDPESHNILVKSLVEKQVFSHVIFSLLSGQTLLILSKNKFSDSISLAERLQIFVPFFNPAYSIATNEIDENDCSRYSIAVSSAIIRNDETNPNTFSSIYNNVSILDFDKGVYTGCACPKGSFVEKKLGSGNDQSERIFLLIQYNILKHSANEFVTKLAEFTKESLKLRTCEKMIGSLHEIGFSKDDEPILRYWVHCYFNKQKLRPILARSEAKSSNISVNFSV
ncbi:hypothetical protein TRFO_29377 [Tritrichomonas foetus]|uniref:UDENN FLCN/SMCR8-type domain-containing protein n=1 Tax=Tritrichomonas foetus TaxID=1144522 RepID=A0A1J4K1D1_9EUKA|nr:hypothetical protein TRFO_29377 [Tritrichomonas foetus]|eukprot:OHT03285.1 hypothetical protein TRFO_29377 [Tritrichomonas foetus]